MVKIRKISSLSILEPKNLYLSCRILAESNKLTMLEVDVHHSELIQAIILSLLITQTSEEIATIMTLELNKFTTASPFISRFIDLTHLKAYFKATAFTICLCKQIPNSILKNGAERVLNNWLAQ